MKDPNRNTKYDLKIPIIPLAIIFSVISLLVLFSFIIAKRHYLNVENKLHKEYSKQLIKKDLKKISKNLINHVQGALPYDVEALMDEMKTFKNMKNHDGSEVKLFILTKDNIVEIKKAYLKDNQVTARVEKYTASALHISEYFNKWRLSQKNDKFFSTFDMRMDFNKLDQSFFNDDRNIVVFHKIFHNSKYMVLVCNFYKFIF